MTIEDSLDLIYTLLEEDPAKAEAAAVEARASASSPEDRDKLDWVRAYALVDLKRFSEAKEIWSRAFERTGNHRALHQVGMVEREAGNLDRALELYLEERGRIDPTDEVAVGANLYELVFCNLLKKDRARAEGYFREYERVNSSDPIERGCFHRLKGDLFRESAPDLARAAYEESLRIFTEADCKLSVKELKERLSLMSER